MLSGSCVETEQAVSVSPVACVGCVAAPVPVEAVCKSSGLCQLRACVRLCRACCCWKLCEAVKAVSAVGNCVGCVGSVAGGSCVEQWAVSAVGPV
jgi:hypothetical protein